MLTSDSRYQGLETTVDIDGRTIAALRVRLLPRADSLTLIATLTVGNEERLDHIAAQAFANPELFWRIADANPATDLAALVERGRTLRITLPDRSGGPSGR